MPAENGSDRNREIEAALEGARVLAESLERRGFELLGVGVAIVYRDGEGKLRAHASRYEDDDVDTTVALGRSVGELADDVAVRMERQGPNA